MDKIRITKFHRDSHEQYPKDPLENDKSSSSQAREHPENPSTNGKSSAQVQQGPEDSSKNGESSSSQAQQQNRGYFSGTGEPSSSKEHQQNRQNLPRTGRPLSFQEQYQNRRHAPRNGKNSSSKEQYQHRRNTLQGSRVPVLDQHRWMCRFCHQTFYYRQELHEHISTFHGQYICCGINFGTCNNFIVHSENHHALQCICGKTFQSNGEFDMHKQKELHYRYRCVACGISQSFLNARDFYCHMMTFSGITICCSLCDTVSNSPLSLKIHLETCGVTVAHRTENPAPMGTVQSQHFGHRVSQSRQSHGAPMYGTKQNISGDAASERTIGRSAYVGGRGRGTFNLGIEQNRHYHRTLENEMGRSRQTLETHEHKAEQNKGGDETSERKEQRKSSKPTAATSKQELIRKRSWR